MSAINVSTGTTGIQREIEVGALENLSLKEWQQLVLIRKASIPKVPKRQINVSDEVRAQRSMNAKRIATELSQKRKEKREEHQALYNLQPNEWWCPECRRVLRLLSLSKHQRTQMHLDNVRRCALQSPTLEEAFLPVSTPPEESLVDV